MRAVPRIAWTALKYIYCAVMAVVCLAAMAVVGYFIIGVAITAIHHGIIDTTARLVGYLVLFIGAAWLFGWIVQSFKRPTLRH